MILKGKYLKLAQKILLIIACVFAFNQILPHSLVFAKEVEFDFGRGPVELILINSPNNAEVNQKTETSSLSQTLPENLSLPYYETWITTTAYTSRIEETDDSPFTAAWGDHVFWGMVASNVFNKGTKIQIPDYYGDKMFSVLDTMNERYQYRLDIWMPDLKDAKTWGVRYVKIRVYK